MALQYSRVGGAPLHLVLAHLLDAITYGRVEAAPLGGNLLEADLLEDFRQVVTYHPDAFPGPAFECRDRSVHFVDDRQEARKQELMRKLRDRRGIPVDPLAVILELGLEILQLRQQLLILAAQFGEFVQWDGPPRFRDSGVLRLVFVLQRGGSLVHLRYLS